MRILTQVINFFVRLVAPAVTGIVKTRALGSPMPEVGWPPLDAITRASPNAAHLLISISFASLYTTLAARAGAGSMRLYGVFPFMSLCWRNYRRLRKEGTK